MADRNMHQFMSNEMIWFTEESLKSTLFHFYEVEWDNEEVGFIFHP